MSPSPYWSYVLTAVGVFGLYLAGKKDRRGWMVGIAAQALWIAYASATHQFGFYNSALAYGWVYIKNARAWKTPPADLEFQDALYKSMTEPIDPDEPNRSCFQFDPARASSSGQWCKFHLIHLDHPLHKYRSQLCERDLRDATAKEEADLYLYNQTHS